MYIHVSIYIYIYIPDGTPCCCFVFCFRAKTTSITGVIIRGHDNHDSHPNERSTARRNALLLNIFVHTSRFVRVILAQGPCNLLCIVPILADDPRRESDVYTGVTFKYNGPRPDGTPCFRCCLLLYDMYKYIIYVSLSLSTYIYIYIHTYIHIYIEREGYIDMCIYI